MITKKSVTDVFLEAKKGQRAPRTKLLFGEMGLSPNADLPQLVGVLWVSESNPKHSAIPTVGSDIGSFLKAYSHVRASEVWCYTN